MARGWESKAVEAQIDAAEVQRRSAPRNPVSSQQLDRIRRKEGLLLSRTRIVRELETVHNPRYRDLLGKALADLDLQLDSMSNT